MDCLNYESIKFLSECQFYLNLIYRNFHFHYHKTINNRFIAIGISPRGIIPNFCYRHSSNL